MSKRKKSVSDSTLHRLWRRAVLAYWNYTDPIDGTYGAENLECHHIVKRKHFVTRWDWRNGLPLSAKSHRWVHEHTVAANKILPELIDTTYLEEMERYIKPDFLAAHGWTEDEFRLHVKGELLKVIEEYED